MKLSDALLATGGSRPLAAPLDATEARAVHALAKVFGRTPRASPPLAA